MTELRDREDTELDKALAAISADFVERLDRMASGGALREGLMKAAVTDLVWALFYQMPDQQSALYDELERVLPHLKDAIIEETQKRRQALA